MNPNFGSIQHVTLTILVDNYASLIAESGGGVEYFLSQPLLAEHGFSALLQVDDSPQSILWDSGCTREVLVENMRRMKIDPQAIRAIALSHGHFDHTGGVSELLRQAVKPPQPPIPIIAHPEIARERWNISADGTKEGPDLPPPQVEWEALGGRMVLSSEPYCLQPGVWTTGQIPRTGAAGPKYGTRAAPYYRVGEAFQPDDIPDDQALVLNLAGKGLVVLSGCAHAGILNTIAYAQQISGVEQIHAVLGGFHLAASSADDVQVTVRELQKLQASVLAPCHCTGPKATACISEQIPESYRMGMVGAKFVL